jgi:hypothetical protein
MKGVDVVSTVLDPTTLGDHMDMGQMDEAAKSAHTQQAVDNFFNDNNGSASGVILNEEKK